MKNADGFTSLAFFGFVTCHAGGDKKYYVTKADNDQAIQKATGTEGSDSVAIGGE